MTRSSFPTARNATARNILDIFGDNNRIAVMDPVYPVYVDTNVMAGHTGPADEAGAYGGLLYLPCNPENGFMPEAPGEHVDLIYLCSPNNPTGAVATRERLDGVGAITPSRTTRVILYDAAYEAYITEPGHSAFDLRDSQARASAPIEFRSFSKNGGFTGVRCAFTVVPKELECRDRPAAKSIRFIPFGTGASARSSTASPTSSSAARRPSTRPKEKRRSPP